jgi:hypothetical protein
VSLPADDILTWDELEDLLEAGVLPVVLNLSGDEVYLQVFTVDPKVDSPLLSEVEHERGVAALDCALWTARHIARAD